MTPDPIQNMPALAVRDIVIVAVLNVAIVLAVVGIYERWTVSMAVGG